MKAKDLHYKTTGKQREHMCRKGELKPLGMGATGVEGRKSSTRLIQPSCRHTIRKKLGRAEVRPAPADWVFWGLPFCVRKEI